MKKSINAWSFPDSYSFEDCLAAAKKWGFDAVEFNLDKEGRSAHSFSYSTTDEQILAVKELADKYGIKICSISSSLHGGTWCKAGAEALEKAEKLLRTELNIAKLCEADTILLVPGGMPDGITLSESRKNSLENLKALIPVVMEYGVKVGLENVWNGFFLSPYDMLSFIDELGSDMFGAYYDLGNMVAFSDTTNWTELLADKTFKIHVKDYKRNGGINRGGFFCNLLEGDVDFKTSMKIFKEHGFDGYLTAEVFKLEPTISDDDFLKSVSEAEDIIQSYYNEA